MIKHFFVVIASLNAGFAAFGPDEQAVHHWAAGAFCMTWAIWCRLDERKGRP